MYENFYGLTARPFQLTPDPAFYFESLTHRKALSYLGYGLNQGEGFIVITGEVGAGKSTLVAHLMATIDPARLTAAQVVTSALSGEEIIHVVAQAFGLVIGGHDKASALAAIEGLLHAEARNGRRCLLVVDEAQNLSIDALEELRMLSNFQLGAQPLLQTLLLGQPEFRELLQTSPELEQLRQRVIAAHHLDAMEADELRPYIEHRLRLVGWNGRPALETALYPVLHQASGGVPRRVNQIANRLFLMGAVEQIEHFDVGLLEQVLAEIANDTALPLNRGAMPRSAAPVPQEVAAALDANPASPTSGLDAAAFHTALAERDALIAELQQAVIEVANQVEQPAMGDPVLRTELADLAARLTRMEQRLEEQEATVKHTLSMLIEWLETDKKAVA
ncbi:XrtA/PEP-CTERM system-associated ATPase [Novosphingobium piscinae]|uniref:AAA family ATPase n=1 Tax=Novosphingobium piscinae TaxID=1507448 RepID=A0A7X1FYY9_9SPHN|nr:XrtA/PEP-CTERM system-associated ATPase [Novosphingobium piscinae]MBC2669589.1 AAA family ATPase [Novosphingobium piscinae]